MNASLMLIFGLCFLAAPLEGITVQVQNFSFSWNSVKTLKSLLDAAPKNPRMRSQMTVPVCFHPQLPSEFLPLCSTPKAANVIRALDTIASEPEICEICANVACSGC
ncbi:guanylin-like [Python bivittatus]|uniref:Guanylin n=1 Tax=Python bivittatus TaxID=176946 RepID=A0A9F3W2R8_PYTBI|nr:guanylin-like [Python bivittatus]